MGILDAIAEFCSAHNLKYFLAAGTLIGAVRHKGFIPWDDDIDIDMPRADYMAFLKLFPKSGRHRAVSIYSDDHYYLPYAKVIDTRTLLKEDISIKSNIGIYVDIFPIDNLTDDFKDGERICHRNSRLQFLLNVKTINCSSKRPIWKNALLVLGKLLLSFVDYRWIVGRQDKNSQEFFANKDSRYVGSVTYGNDPKKVIVERKLLEDIIDLEFEGKQYHCPREYHKILTQYYGDYMTLPPEEQRHSTHVNEAFWLD